MTGDNQTAKRYLDQVFDLFSIQFDNGSRYPGTRQEAEEAGKLLKKARAAEPDDPKIIYRLERAEEIASGALERVWCGSYIIVFFSIIIVLYSLQGFGPKNVRNMFNWPSKETVADQLESAIQQQEQKIERLENRTNSDANKEGRIESARERLTELREMDVAELRDEAISSRVWSGLKSLFLMVYAVSMMILYIYTARTPRFLSKKRQREYELAKQSSDFLVKTFWSIAGALFGMAGALFSQPPTRWIYRYTDGSKEYRDEHHGLISGLVVLVMAVAFIWWVVDTVARIVFYSIWAIVLVQYMRNYQYERSERWIERLKELYAEWKEKRALQETKASTAISEPPSEEK